MTQAQQKQRRSRGVRLSDLDRSRVYRLAFVGRRWEVLGPEDAVGPGGGPGADDDGVSDGVARTAAYAPRHAAPDAVPPRATPGPDHV